MSHSHDHTPTTTGNPALDKKHARVLKAVLAINGVMVVVESVTGYFSRSTALIADMLDMLGDTLGAGTGLLVNKRSKRWQAGAALAKSGFMSAVALGILAEVGLRFFNPVMPVAATMGVVGGLALVANGACAALLYRYRKDNLNIKSSFACIRNDMISNVGVIAAAVAAHFLNSPLPDIIVAAAVSGLCLKSAVSIAREAIADLRGKGHDDHDEHSGTAHSHKHGLAPKIGLKLKSVLQNPFNRKAKKTAVQPKPAAAAAVKAPAAHHPAP